jgi:hypothetical protein
MKNEVVVQNLHNTGWTWQCEAAGARMIEVEYPEQIERAIGGKTAIVYFRWPTNTSARIATAWMSPAARYRWNNAPLSQEDRRPPVARRGG